MADGLIIRHPQTGAVIFDVNKITSHNRSVITTNGSAGSANIPEMLRGAPYILQALPTNDNNYNVPNFTISGQTLSWNSASQSMRVIVGSRATAPPAGSTQFSGALFRNPANSAILLGSVDLALQLASYGALTLYDDGQAHPQPMVAGTLVVSGTNPVLAFRGEVGAEISIRRINVSGSQFTFYFTCRSSSPVSLIYWIFDVASQGLALSSTAALVLRDPVTGVKTFDSRSYVMSYVANTTAPTAGGSSTVNQGSGQVLAVIQSTFGYRYVMADQGGYSTGSSPPSEAVRGEVQNPRPPGTTFAYMRLQSYHPTARLNANGSMTCGMTEFEFFEWWYPASTQPLDDRYGTARHTIIDVSGLPSASMPNPNEVVVAASATTRSVTVTSSTATTTQTPSVTVTPSGGTAPYTYLWQRVSGATAVVANGSTTSATFSTQSTSQAAGTTAQAVWQCRVTDSQGNVGYSPEITFTHTVALPDLSADPVTNFSAVVEASNNHDVLFGVEYRRITGITGPVTIRMERYSFSGTADTVELLMVTSTDLVNWYTRGTVNAKGTGLAYVDYQVQPNEYVGWKVRVATNSGRKTAAMTIVMWNLSDPSGPVQMTNTSGHSFVVDDDNNYNMLDVTPNAMNFPNISWSTNDNAVYGAFNSNGPTVSGINTSITLRFECTARGGNVDYREIFIQDQSGNTYASASAFNVGTFRDVVVNNGSNFIIKFSGSTNSGTKTHTSTWRVTNQNTGAVIDTFTISVTVDADNNYNVTDATLNSISPPFDKLTWYDNEAFTAGSSFNVSGINTTVTLRFNTSNRVNNGAILTAQIWVVRQRPGNYYEDYRMVPNNSLDVTVQNGDTITVKGYASGNNTPAEVTWNWSVRNQTTGGNVIGGSSTRIALNS